MRTRLIIIMFMALIWSGKTAYSLQTLSMVTTPIYLAKDDSFKIMGTGFFFMKEDSVNGKLLFLITNYHVITGNSPGSSGAPIGNHIIFFVHKNVDNPSDVLKFDLPLFTQNNKPTWLASDSFPNADVVVLPLPPIVMDLISQSNNSSTMYQLNQGIHVRIILPFAITQDFMNVPCMLKPMSEVTLIGYPLNFYDCKNFLPVWKSGSIASEPDFDFNGMPCILVDASLFHGMSGSPVFVKSEMGNVPFKVGMGRIDKFLGILASEEIRPQDIELKLTSPDSVLKAEIKMPLQVGYIWKAEVIMGIIDKFNYKKYKEDILLHLPPVKHK
jgi:hypothetical protein